MIRAILMLALLASPAMAGDNNPFSGAREITVVMVRDGNQNTKRNVFFSSSYPRQQHQRVRRLKN